jgi:outer membrane protein assembly factor BamB
MYRNDAHEDRSLLLFGVERELTAYNRDTGKIAWTFQHETMYGYYVDFVVMNGRVFLAAGKWVVCLDYKTGKPLGQVELPSIVLRILEDDDRIYAFGGDDLSCLDKEGRLIWTTRKPFYADSKMPTVGFPGNIIRGFRDSG